MAATVQNSKTVGLKFVTSETTLKIENARNLFLLNSFSSLVFNSSDFNSGPDDVNIWCLYVRLESGNVDVTVTNKTSKNAIEAAVTLTVVTDSGTRTKFKNLQSQIYQKSANNYQNYATYKQLLCYNTDKYLPYNNLTLHCVVSTLQTYNESAKEFQIPANNIENDFVTMLHDGKFSDVVIVVKGNEIKAHKNILAVRSPVFAAMFESDMKETRENRVIISDLDYEVAQEMLHFIYTGKAPKLGEMADRLLMAADKYSLDALKAMCEQELCKNISVDRVTELMALADLHQTTQLKNELREFIEASIKKLMNKTSLTKLASDQSFNLLMKELSKFDSEV